MDLLIFKYYFWKLKRKYQKLLKFQRKYDLKKIEKNKFINFFIKDEEDKILNKKVLDDFGKKLTKYKTKIYKLKNKIDKILFNLDIIDLNFIEILYKFKVSQEDLNIIKEIFKNKITK